MRAEVLGLMRAQCLGGFAHVERRDHGWAIALGGCGVFVSTTWRIIDGDQVAVASGDDGHPFGLGHPMDAAREANARLGGHAISEMEVDRSTGDLLVAFRGGQRLQVLTTSAGYEGWIASFTAERSAIDLICGGGGALSMVRRPVGAPAEVVTGQPLP